MQYGNAWKGSGNEASKVYLEDSLGMRLMMSPPCVHTHTPVEAKFTTTSEKNAKMKEAMKVAEQKVAQTQAQVQM